MMKALGVLAAAAAVLLACSGNDAVIGTGSTSTGSGSSSGGPVSSGSTSGSFGSSSEDASAYGPFPGTSSSSGPVATSIDLAGLTSITVGRDTCGKPAGTCLDAQSFIIDFVKGTVTHVTCIELGSTGDAGPGKTANAKTISALNSDRSGVVLKDLAAIQLSPDLKPDWGFDGPLITLEVNSASGRHVYSPDAGCNNDGFRKITSGFDQLWDAVKTFQ
jgi:hypothetical protein